MSWRGPLTLLGLALLLVGGVQAAEQADIPFYFGRSGLGDVYKLEVAEPTATTPKYWNCANDEVQQDYQPLASWQLGLGGPVMLGDSHDYVIWVESTNVQEISFRTTLYLNVTGERTDLSTQEVSRSGSFQEGWLAGNYTMELVDAPYDAGPWADGVPPYAVFGIELETRITWAPDTNNRTAWVKAASVDGCGEGGVACDSRLQIEMQPVLFDPAAVFSNDRVDEEDGDSLFLKVNITNALGVDTFDDESGGVRVVGVSGGGSFQESLNLIRRHTYLMELEARWHYQQDDGISAGWYDFRLSITDTYGNLWEATISYELEVDRYEAAIESEATSQQVARGRDVDFRLKILNAGNTRDTFGLELDDSGMPAGWQAQLLDDSELELATGQYDYATIQVGAPAGAPGGSSAQVLLTVRSQGDTTQYARVTLTASVRTHGVTLSGVSDHITIDPQELNPEGEYHFQVTIHNTGSDRDTYNIDATVARSDWNLRVEEGGTSVSSVTVEKGQAKQLDVVLKPVNYQDRLGDEVEFRFTASSVPPGDGSDELESNLVMVIPVERVVDLELVEVQVNGQPLELLAPDVLQEGDSVQLQVLVRNHGGLATGEFSVTLSLGQREEARYRLDGQEGRPLGLPGYGEAIITLEWRKAAPGTTVLSLNADPMLEVVDEFDRSDNLLSITLQVAEAPETANDDDSTGDSGLLPGFSTALALAGIISVVARRRRV